MFIVTREGNRGQTSTEPTVHCYPLARNQSQSQKCHPEEEALKHRSQRVLPVQNRKTRISQNELLQLDHLRNHYHLESPLQILVMLRRTYRRKRLFQLIHRTPIVLFRLDRARLQRRRIWVTISASSAQNPSPIGVSVYVGIRPASESSALRTTCDTAASSYTSASENTG